MQMMIESSFGNTRGPVFTESLLRTIHLANQKRYPVSLKMVSTPSGIGLAVDCTPELRTLFVQELQDNYPGTNVRPVADMETKTSPVSLWVTKTCDALSITAFDRFTDETDKRQLADPVAGILSAFRLTASGRVPCSLSLMIRPATERRVKATIQQHHRLSKGFKFRSAQQLFLRCSRSDRIFVRGLGRLLGILANTQVVHSPSELPTESLFECELTLTAATDAKAAQVARKRLVEVAGTLGRFNNADVQFMTSRKRLRRGFIMSAKEIASIWHPLTVSPQWCSIR